MNRDQFLQDPAVLDGVKTALERGLRNILVGAQEDIRKFVAEMADDVVLAAQAGDEAGIAELQAQFKALAEANRLRAANVAWTAAADVVGSITGLLISTATRITI